MTGATAGKTYTFWVTGTNIIGESDYSNEFSIIAATLPSNPTAVISTYDGV